MSWRAIGQKSTATNNQEQKQPGRLQRLKRLAAINLVDVAANPQPPIMTKLCNLDPPRCYLEPEFFARS